MEIVGASRRPLSRKFPSLGGVAAKPPGWSSERVQKRNKPPKEGNESVCRKVADHPVSRFASATPPKEGNWKSPALRAAPLAAGVVLQARAETQPTTPSAAMRRIVLPVQ